MRDNYEYIVDIEKVNNKINYQEDNTNVLYDIDNKLLIRDNKEMYAVWLNGFIYVDRNNRQNRKDEIGEKLNKVFSSKDNSNPDRFKNVKAVVIGQGTTKWVDDISEIEDMDN